MFHVRNCSIDFNEISYWTSTLQLVREISFYCRPANYVSGNWFMSLRLAAFIWKKKSTWRQFKEMQEKIISGSMQKFLLYLSIRSQWSIQDRKENFEYVYSTWSTILHSRMFDWLRLEGRRTWIEYKTGFLSASNRLVGLVSGAINQERLKIPTQQRNGY
jgi:hypothetical protein